jgi:hypothetical protein
MSRSYWLPVIAAVGLVLSGSIQANPIGHGPGDHHGTKQATGEPQTNSQPATAIAVQNDIKRIASALEAANAKQPSADDKQQAQENLEAQKRMAFWARFMFFVALAETIVTAFGVWLVWHTLKASWAAAIAASEGTKKAGEAIAQSEAHSRRQLRAYVGVVSITQECPSENDLGAYKPVDTTAIAPVYTDYTAITLRNFGQTPASEVCTRGALIAVRGPIPALPDDFDMDQYLNLTHVKAKEIVPRAYLNAGQEVTHKEVIRDIKPIVFARRRECSVFHVGRVYYRDAYGRNWSTYYCYLWEPWHAMGERFYPYERFNGEDQTPYPQNLTYAPYPTELL